jgi:hypothetical protein
MGSKWILGRLAGGCVVDSNGSGKGPVAGCGCGDVPFGSGTMELVSQEFIIKQFSVVIVFI